MPKISVFMPVYNSEKYIALAINSILTQSYEDFELIILDDGSTDASMDIVRSFQDSRIKIFSNLENKGIEYTRNRGLKLCQGEFFAPMDSDDIALRDRLKLSVEYLEQHKELSGVFGKTALIDKDNNITEGVLTRCATANEIEANLIFNNVITNSGAMIRKEHINELDLSYEGKYAEDYGFFSKLARYGGIELIDEYLILYRQAGEGISNNTVQEKKYYYEEMVKNQTLSSYGFELSDEERRIFHKTFTRMSPYIENWEVDILILLLNRMLNIAQNNRLRFYEQFKHRVNEMIDSFRKQGFGLEGVSTSPKIKVSVVVPVYNAEKYIDRCMENLLQQTLQDIEIIAVNDCSTDNSKDLLDKWQREYPDIIKVIHLSENKGPGGARNIGIKHICGEYAGFMDCDDVIDFTMYEKLYNLATENNSDVVDCGYFDEKNKNVIYPYAKEVTGILDDDKRNELITGPGYMVTKIFKSEFLRKNECAVRENVIYEDLDFLIKVILCADRIDSVNEILYQYKDNANSASNEKREQKKYDDMLAAIEAISRLEYTQSVKMAVDYAMLSCYACAISFCLFNQDNQEFLLIDNLKRLKAVSKGKWDDWRSNQYLMTKMPDDNRELIQWYENL